MYKKNMIGSGFVAILISAFFLCSPVVGFVDPLPNCIGYLLLCLGLYRLSDLSEHLCETFRRVRILLLLSILSLIACYFIYGVLGQSAEPLNENQQLIYGEMGENPYQQPVWILIASFVSLVVQWCFLIPTLRMLFRGIGHLAERYGGDALTREKNRKTLPERMSRATTVFFILSSILSLLPELTVLTYFEYHEENPLFPFDWYEYVVLFRAACGLVAFVVGLIWLIRMIRFCTAAMRDLEWIERLDARYRADVLPQVGMLTVRRFSAGFSLLQVALIFSINLRMNHRAVLPGIILAILAIFALCLLRRYLPPERSTVGIVSGVMLALASAAHLWLSHSYLRKYLPDASLYDPNAYRSFLLVRAADVLEIVFTLVLLAVLLAFLTALAREHTEVNYGGHDARYLSADATARLHKEFQKRAIVCGCLFFLAAAAGVLEAWLRIEYPWLWLPSAVLSIAGIWSAWSMIYELKAQIQFRYQSDGTNKNI